MTLKIIALYVALPFQIKTHCENSKLDNQFQHAYKSGNSTETALVNIKSDKEASLAKGRPTALVMLD
jgi:hypothetical protein